jgi:Spy/CpxP family protein refolding chaperone
MIFAGAVAATGCAEEGEEGAQPKTPVAAAPAPSAEEAVPATGEADDEQSPGADELRAFHRHHHTGFIGFALISISTLGVSSQEQAAVDQIKKDLEAKFRPARDAEAAFLNAVADGVAAGQIDNAKVDPTVAKITELSTQMDDVTNDGLNKLHAVLSAPERQALALKVQAHYQIWFKANADEAAQPNQEKEGGHIHHLAKVLALSADQVSKIDDEFTKSIGMAFAGAGRFDTKGAEQHLNAFVAAFPNDNFDAKTLTTADKANSSVATWGAQRMLRMYQAMVPVLTPDQRTKLAALLREHATKLEAEVAK